MDGLPQGVHRKMNAQKSPSKTGAGAYVFISMTDKAAFNGNGFFSERYQR